MKQGKKENLISHYYKKHKKSIISLPLGYGKSVQTIECAKQDIFDKPHLIVVDTKKEVERFKEELPKYLWYYQTDFKKANYILKNITKELKEIEKIDERLDFSEYGIVEAILDEIEKLKLSEESSSIDEFDEDIYDGVIITKKKFNDLIENDEGIRWLKQFESISIDEISNLSFARKFEFENYATSTLKGIGKLDMDLSKLKDSKTETFKYGEVNNFFERLSNENSAYFIQKNEYPNSCLYMKNTVLIDFLRTFDGHIMILDATADYSGYIYKELCEPFFYLNKKQIKDIKVKIEKTKTQLEQNKDVRKNYLRNELKNDIKVLNRYFKSKEINEEFLEILKKYTKDYKLSTFVKDGRQTHKYPNLKIKNYKLKPLNSDRTLIPKTSELRIHNNDSDESIQEKIDIIRQCQIKSDLIFSNKSTIDSLNENGEFRDKKLDYLYSGNDIGSNKYRNEKNMCILYGQTINQGYIRMLEFFFNEPKAKLKAELIAQRIIQLIGRTFIRENPSNEVEIEIIHYPELDINYISNYYTGCDTRTSKTIELTGLKTKKEALIEVVKRELVEQNLTEVVPSKFIAEIMMKYKRGKSKDTQNQTSRKLKEILPELGYKPNKTGYIWKKVNASK